MAAGALILNSFYITVWLSNNIVAPELVGGGEIVLGVLIPLVSAIAIMLSRDATPSRGFHVPVELTALLLNTGAILLLVPEILFEIYLSLATRAPSIGVEDFQAAALFLLTLTLNSVALLPWTVANLARR